MAFRLTQNTNAGDSIIAIDRRVDVVEGQLLRIGDVPNGDDEYVLISDIPNQNTAAPPDAGNITLEHQLNRDHATDTIVYLQDDPVPAAKHATSLVLAAGTNADTLYISDGTGNANAYALNDIVEFTNQNERFYHRLSANFSAAGNVGRVSFNNPPFARSHAMGTGMAARDSLLTIRALDAGMWGDRLRVSIEDEEDGLVQGTQLEQANTNPPLTIRLNSSLGVEEGTILEFSQNGAVVGATQKVDGIDRRTGEITLAAPGLDALQTAALGAGPLDVRSREFRVNVYLLRQPDQAVPTRNVSVLDSEQFRYLSMDPRHSRYISTVIGNINVPANELRRWDRRSPGESAYVRVTDINPDNTIRFGPEPLEDTLPSGRVVPAQMILEDVQGFDAIANITHDTYIGVDAPEPEDRTGIQALRNYEDISLVSAPGQTDARVQRGLIEHCEAERYRFAVIDGPAPPADTLSDVRAQRQQFDTKYAAMYHPWLMISQPFPRNLAEIQDYAVPPAGHITGVFARTDVERGVHKAPANEVVRGINGLKRELNKREHDILNPSPSNINVIRDFRNNNRGIRVWGGRVITSDTDWKYVNVRRLMIFVEHSIERGLQWVVFEPNYESTWARVRRSISNFLTVVWRNGALEGTTVEEAFFVKCDRTTMTQTDIDNGRLIAQIGIATAKPAEFVIIRIGLWTAHADTE